MRERKCVDLSGCEGWEDLGGVGEGKTVIRIYCMKKYFSIKEEELESGRRRFPFSSSSSCH